MLFSFSLESVCLLLLLLILHAFTVILSFLHLLSHLHVSLVKHIFFILFLSQFSLFLRLLISIPLSRILNIACLLLSVFYLPPGLAVIIYLLTFFSSAFNSAILLARSLTSSSALLRACLESTTFLDMPSS